MVPHPWEDWLRDRSNIYFWSVLAGCSIKLLRLPAWAFFYCRSRLDYSFFYYTNPDHITCVTKWVIPTKSFWKGNRLSVIKQYKRLVYKSTLAVHYIVSVGFCKISHYETLWMWSLDKIFSRAGIVLAELGVIFLQLAEVWKCMQCMNRWILLLPQKSTHWGLGRSKAIKN